MNKAVVLGCNYYIGLSVIRCLGREGVHVVACDYDFIHSYGAKSKYISEFLKIENLNQFGEEAFLGLMEYGKKQTEKPVLLPTHDKYVEFIDNYYEDLEKYYLISQAKGLNSKLLDKWSLADIALENGVKIPTTINADDENLMEKVETLLGFPCIIKPYDTVRFTKVFRNKVFICKDKEALLSGIKKACENKIDIFIQEIVPGFDDHMLTYDYYIDRSGKTTHYLTARKRRQWPINFGASVFTEQRYDKRLVDIGLPFLEKIGYRGFGEIEFKEHEKTGEIYLIEINARTTNFNNLIYTVGINMPYIAYKDLTQGLDEKDRLFLTHDTGYAFIYGFEDMMAIRGYAKTGQMSVFQSLKISLSRKWAPAIFDWKDIRPWMFYNNVLLKKALKKIFRR